MPMSGSFKPPARGQRTSSSGAAFSGDALIEASFDLSSRSSWRVLDLADSGALLNLPPFRPSERRRTVHASTRFCIADISIIYPGDSIRLVSLAMSDSSACSSLLGNPDCFVGVLGGSADLEVAVRSFSPEMGSSFLAARRDELDVSSRAVDDGVTSSFLAARREEADAGASSSGEGERPRKRRCARDETSGSGDAAACRAARLEAISALPADPLVMLRRR